jgi:hypothetical protein
MTISEASAVNVLLSYILGGSSAGDVKPERESVEQASVYLADRAVKALGAGWSGDRVSHRLPERSEMDGFR